MAVSDSSKVDLLYKKLFGVTKTDTSTNKGAGNESIASPSLVRGDKIWVDAASIPAIAADVTNIVQSYLTTNRIECTADTTTTPVGSVYPTWKTNITDWISPEFGSTYFVKVYAETAGNANPTNGIPLSDAGAGNAGEWFFDYQSGVLNFIGGTIPAALTAAKVVYITGYRYIGAVGITSQTNATTATTANVALTANVANTVLTLSNFTTANLTEGSNQYFTNARVTANLSQQSINVFADVDITGITTNGILSWNGTSFVAGTVGGSATSNVALIAYQADHANTSDNSNVANSVLTISNFTTSNLREGSNLYYTNTRVYSNVISFLPSLAGSGIQIQANGQINATASDTAGFASTSNVANTVLSISNFTTANLAESTNLYYTNSRVLAIVTPYLTTSNVAEGTNLYYTNSRVVSAVTPYLTTSNVSEGSNLYYTNARVITEVTPYLTTANVLESSSNLYYTNARVFANVAQMSINVFADVDMTGLQTSGILIWNGTSFVAGTVSAAASSNVALIAYQADHANTSDNSNVANSVLSLTGLTTSNLLEGTNLYFTNTRAAIGLTGLNVNVNDLYAAGNLTVQGEFTTLNVATLNIEDKNITLGKGLTSAAQADGAGISIDGAQANITYLVSGDKFNINKNVEIIGDISANTWTGIYSANVIESTNQYFTNTRAVLAITPYLTTANVTEVNNQYFTNARVVANLQLQSINVLADVDISGINNDELLLWNSSDRVFRPSSLTNKLTTANVVELTNLYFTNARVISTLSDGTANLTLYNLTTNGLLTLSSGSGEETTTGIEFKNNPAGGVGDTAKIQYYAANIGVNDDTILEISVANNAGDSINLKTAGGGVGINVARPIAEFDVAGNINARNSLLFSTLVTGPSAAFNIVTSNTWNGLYTANVIESASNLYFTNARALAAVQSSLATNTSNVAEGSNLYYTNSRVISAITPYLTTANVTELTNQYFTNARVFANVAEMSVNVFADVDITGVQAGYSLVWNGSSFIASAPQGAVDNANIANIVLSISNFTTANLVEGNNLYYTNSRVLSALTGNVTVGNLKVSTALNYSNTTGVTKVYQYYNETNLSLDTIFL